MQSFHNSYYSSAKQAEPEVGMGATVCFYSDRKAGTIIWRENKTLVVQLDKSIRADDNGMSDEQQYTYERDIHGQQYEFTLRKNGRWIQKGAGMKSGTSLGVGFRRTYYDYSF
jgi:hypothetical protein